MKDNLYISAAAGVAGYIINVLMYGNLLGALVAFAVTFVMCMVWCMCIDWVGLLIKNPKDPL